MKNIQTEDNEKSKEQSDENSFKVINPSRTVKPVIPLMTMDSNDKADMIEKNYEDEIPFIPSLEVIRYMIRRKK